MQYNAVILGVRESIDMSSDLLNQHVQACVHKGLFKVFSAIHQREKHLMGGFLADNNKTNCNQMYIIQHTGKRQHAMSTSRRGGGVTHSVTHSLSHSLRT